MVWGKGRIAGGIDPSQDWGSSSLCTGRESWGESFWKFSSDSFLSVKEAKSEQLLPSAAHSLF